MRACEQALREESEGFFGEFRREGLAVEVEVALFFKNGKNAEAFLRLGDDARGLVLDASGGFESLGGLGHVVALDRLDVPAEGFDFRGEGSEIEDLRRGAGLLIGVLIDDQRQVAGFVETGGGDRFPDLAFAHFTIAGEDVDMGVELIDLEGQGHAESDAQTLAERSGAGFDPGQATGEVGMAFKGAAKFAESHDFFHREETGFREGRVENRDGVSFREDESISVWSVGVVLAQADVPAKEERRDAFSGRKAAGWVSAARFGRDLDDLFSDFRGLEFQIFEAELCRFDCHGFPFTNYSVSDYWLVDNGCCWTIVDRPAAGRQEGIR